MANINTHYDTLKVARDAPDTVIRVAYKALLQRYHPDKYDGSQEEAINISQKIQEAFSVISDPEKRAKYDASIADLERKQDRKASADRIRILNEKRKKEKESQETQKSVQETKKSSKSSWSLLIAILVIVFIFLIIKFPYLQKAALVGFGAFLCFLFWDKFIRIRCPKCNATDYNLVDEEEIDRWRGRKQVTERLGNGKSRTRNVSTTFVTFGASF